LTLPILFHQLMVSLLERYSRGLPWQKHSRTGAFISKVGLLVSSFWMKQINWEASQARRVSG
jgi:hypothetical protein